MTKPLTGTACKTYHYVDGVKTGGAHTGLRGDVSGLRGNVSDLQGDVTGLSGNVTGLRGNMDEIPYSARPCDISDWIEE
jgi:hypothetical protein